MRFTILYKTDSIFFSHSYERVFPRSLITSAIIFLSFAIDLIAEYVTVSVSINRQNSCISGRNRLRSQQDVILQTIEWAECVFISILNTTWCFITHTLCCTDYASVHDWRILPLGNCRKNEAARFRKYSGEIDDVVIGRMTLSAVTGENVCTFNMYIFVSWCNGIEYDSLLRGSGFDPRSRQLLIFLR